MSLLDTCALKPLAINRLIAQMTQKRGDFIVYGFILK
jgi:hypothetical protein